LHTNTAHTAILVFAYSAVKEASQKAIFKEKHHNQRLSSDLLRHTLDVCRQSRLPYYHISENCQVGSSFAERLIHAFESVFDLGYENVISIGSDCPQLSAGVLLKAAQSLENGRNKSVIGPSYDGGMYLMGWNRTIFNADAIRKIEWQNGKDYHQLVQCLSYFDISPDILPARYDVDHVLTLQRLLQQRLIPYKLLNLLRRYVTLRYLKSGILAIDHKILSPFLDSKSLRAPPAF